MMMSNTEEEEGKETSPLATATTVTPERLEHLGTISISVSAILKMLALPEQYELRDVDVNPHTMVLTLVVEHPSIPSVEEGRIFPEVCLIYTRANIPPPPPLAELTRIEVQWWDGTRWQKQIITQRRRLSRKEEKKEEKNHV